MSRDERDDSPFESDHLKALIDTIYRSAGKARDAITRIGEKGAVALLGRKLQAEREKLVTQLGALSLSRLAGGETLAADDADARALIDAIVELDGRIARLDEQDAAEANGR
jgi:hypothetical protein